jgi:hypothetical protein
LDYKGDIALQLSELSERQPLTEQYLQGINDALRIVINEVQTDKYEAE